MKIFGPWLKASPWKPMTEETTMYESGIPKSCGKRLFFTKTKSFNGTSDMLKTGNIQVVTTLMNKVGLGNDKATNAEDKEELEDREVLGLVQAGTGSDIISKGLGVQNDSMGMSGAGRHVDRVDGAPVELLAHSE